MILERAADVAQMPFAEASVDVSDDEPQPLTEMEANILAKLEKVNIPNRGIQVDADIMWKLQEKRDAYEAFKIAEQDGGDNFIYFPDFDIDADKEAKPHGGSTNQRLWHRRAPGWNGEELTARFQTLQRAALARRAVALPTQQWRLLSGKSHGSAPVVSLPIPSR